MEAGCVADHVFLRSRGEGDVLAALYRLLHELEKSWPGQLLEIRDVQGWRVMTMQSRQCSSKAQVQGVTERIRLCGMLERPSCQHSAYIV